MKRSFNFDIFLDQEGGFKKNFRRRSSVLRGGTVWDTLVPEYRKHPDLNYKRLVKRQDSKE